MTFELCFFIFVNDLQTSIPLLFVLMPLFQPQLDPVCPMVLLPPAHWCYSILAAKNIMKFSSALCFQWLNFLISKLHKQSENNQLRVILEKLWPPFTWPDTIKPEHPPGTPRNKGLAKAGAVACIHNVVHATVPLLEIRPLVAFTQLFTDWWLCLWVRLGTFHVYWRSPGMDL